MELCVKVNDDSIIENEFFRLYRPDVMQHLNSQSYYHGFCIEYLLPPQHKQIHLDIMISDNHVIQESLSLSASDIAYRHLLTEERVLNRQHIYGSGPPLRNVAEEIKVFINNIEGKTLDFGCGSGAVVQYLRNNSVESYGIELNHNDMDKHILRGIKEYITLYNGELPLAFQDDYFQTVTAFEVIEHIADYENIITELVRISKSQLILSVPDMSAIPKCSGHHIVPWHLLESTHVNFFTVHSLQKLLSKYFNSLKFHKIARVNINDENFYNSILVICEKNT